MEPASVWTAVEFVMVAGNVQITQMSKTVVSFTAGTAAYLARLFAFLV